MNPSVRSLTDFYQLAISYPAKFLPFSGQINEAKITLAWSFADSKEGKNTENVMVNTYTFVLLCLVPTESRVRDT